MTKILYLEDNPNDVELTRIELKKSLLDFSMDVANTVAQALKLLSGSTKYDIAILDLRLPDGSGIDVMLEIRNKNLRLPVIILTGSGNEESAISALKAGANDYITKNINFLSKLPIAINNVIANFKYNNEIKSEVINVLYVEWNNADIDLTKRHFQKYAPNINIESVSQSNEALELLEVSTQKAKAFDVLLMDYRLQGLDALETLKIIRQEKKLQIPIVLVTGHGNEEIAVQALKFGADEYLVKRENYLFRLPSLITNAYQRYRLEQQQIELAKSESRYRLLAENSGDVIAIIDMDLNYVYVSPAVKELRGFEVEETLKQNISDVIVPESYNHVIEILKNYLPQKGKRITEPISPLTLELEMYRKDGSTVWTEVKVSLAVDKEGFPVGLQSVTRDISKRKEAREQLVKSREEYKSFFDDDLTGDYIADVEGNLITCNPAYLQIMGFDSLETAQQHDLTKLYANPNARIQLLEKIRKEKRLYSHSVELIRQDGKIIHVTANIVGDFNSDNELVTIKGYLIDDTDRKKASEELRKLSRAIEQSPVSVIITDIEGNIEYVNPKFSEVSGYSREEVYGKNPRILKSDITAPEVYKNLWKTIKSGKSWSGEFQNKRKDNTLYWENASISPIVVNNKVTHYIAVKEDITEKKAFEEELIIARDKAEESNQLKSAFLATMSHELRTPLNAIIGFSSLIDQNLRMENLIEFGEIINKSGNHLLNIIEDIFSISMLQTGDTKSEFDDFSLADFTKLLQQNVRAEKKEKDKDHLKLIITQPAEDRTQIKTDKTKLFQILINFAKNAIAYTDKGEIEIGYSISGSDVNFFVRDTGIGIPEDKVDIIFERFRQIDQTLTRKYGGVGLGLAICKEIAQVLNGKIRVESELDKGSTFHFTLENVVVQPAVQKNDGTDTEAPDFSNKTILIVEDEESNYMLMEIFIKRTKAKIIWAQDGEESIEICKSNSNIDLVLMDIRMPGIDGIEASKQIKSFNPKLTIIAQTAFALHSDRNKLTESDCDDYISKPIRMEELFDKLRKHL